MSVLSRVVDAVRGKPARPAPTPPVAAPAQPAPVPPPLTDAQALVVAPVEMRVVPIITARELYAAHAMAALMSNAGHNDVRTIVQDAHKYADALVREMRA